MTWEFAKSTMSKRSRNPKTKSQTSSPRLKKRSDSSVDLSLEEKDRRNWWNKWEVPRKLYHSSIGRFAFSLLWILMDLSILQFRWANLFWFIKNRIHCHCPLSIINITAYSLYQRLPITPPLSCRRTPPTRRLAIIQHICPQSPRTRYA